MKPSCYRIDGGDDGDGGRGGGDGGDGGVGDNEGTGSDVVEIMVLVWVVRPATFCGGVNEPAAKPSGSQHVTREGKGESPASALRFYCTRPSFQLLRAGQISFDLCTKSSPSSFTSKSRDTSS